MARTCTHLTHDLKIVNTNVDVCEECIKTGDTWVHLRLCTECGHVGCCDSSKNKHATKHFHHTKHPIMRSIEPGEAEIWLGPGGRPPIDPVADRIRIEAGDFFVDPLPEGDLFALGRILYDWTEEKILKLLSKIHERLPAGGALLIA